MNRFIVGASVLLVSALLHVCFPASSTGRPQQNQPKLDGQQRADDPSFAPLVEVQHEDYATARGVFRTNLLRKGPSPQPWEPVSPPVGVSEVEYSSDKLRLKAWINRPKDGNSKRPGVLFLHGGFAFGLEDWEMSQPFRDAGYIVLMPILRAENGQPGAFTFFYDEVDDVLAAAECLSQQPQVDPNHLFIAGPSAGGTLALLAAMTSKRFQAVASFSATPDQVLFCKHAKNAARDVPVDITNLRELEMRSPLAYATSFKCPARIFYGSLEPQWKQTSQLMADLAKKEGLDVEAVQVEGNHETSVRPAIEQAIAFFRNK